MASLGMLVAAIAKVEGLDVDQVGRVARYLREADLINMKGRGGSAAKMGAADAANLLIGINASRVAVAAAKVVPSYRDLEAREVRVASDPRPGAPVLGTFGPALETLVTTYLTGQFPDQFMGQETGPVTQLKFEHGALNFQIAFLRPFLGASIRITVAAGHDLGYEFENYYAEIAAPIQFITFRPRSRVHLKHYKPSDRLEQTTITHRTLLAVAECLRK